jgi:D-3-phosphoglycerate dehydrogenase / 2-oxoglutarate reductase
LRNPAMRILIAEPEEFSAEALRTLSRFARVECRRLKQSEMRAALARYDAIWLRLHLQVQRTDLPPKPRCRFVVTATTGVDHIDVKAAHRAGIEVISLRGHSAFLKTISATAELTIGLILGLLRQIPAASESVRRGEWKRDLFKGRELQGKTAGIVGYGRLGRKVARYLKAFGMPVLVYDPHVRGIAQERSLEQLLRKSDLVSVHVSLTPETERMFTARRFAQMKRGSWFVNTSRGAVVDERALLAALKSGRLAGAALDVLCGEPRIDRKHPLVRYAAANSNLLLTPHIGGAACEAMAKCENYLAQVVLRRAAKK